MSQLVLPTLTSTPPPQAGRGAGSLSPDSQEGSRRRAATALSGREGRSPAPRGRGAARGGGRRKAGEAGWRESWRAREKSKGGRSDPIEADKDRGAGERTRKGGGGARGAGRPTPNCAAAASSAELLGSPARRLLNELRGHPRPPTFQFHGPRSAREMQPVPDAGKARGAGGWEQGSRSKLRGARCGARGGPLSPR